MTPKVPLPSSPRLQLALQLGIATLMAFAGLTIVLGTLGIIDADPDAGPARRITALLVGALVAALGLGLIIVPLRELAIAQGARGDARALFLGVRLLLRRIDLRSAVAAASLVPLAWGAWFTLNGTRWPGPDGETLIDLVVIEFLLIHGFPFLAFAATVTRAASPRRRAFGFTLVGLLLLFYGLLAWQEAAGWGILGLVYLALPNFLAFSHADDDGKIRATAIARWIVKIVTFLGTAMLLGERELQGPGNIEIALYYFGIQAAIELFRVAEIPQDLGAAWERLPPQKRPTIWAAS